MTKETVMKKLTTAKRSEIVLAIAMVLVVAPIIISVISGSFTEFSAFDSIMPACISTIFIVNSEKKKEYEGLLADMNN